MARLFYLFLFVYLLVPFCLTAQDSNIENLNWSPNIYNQENGPDIYFDLYWTPFTMGNPYVRTQVGREGFLVEGYYYDGVYYDGRDLSDQGIIFPFYSDGYIRMSADAVIMSGTYCGVESIRLSSRRIFTGEPTAFDLDGLSDSIKDCLDDYRRNTDGSWEEFVDFYNFQIFEVSLNARITIENAIRAKVRADERQNANEQRRRELWNIYQNVCNANYDEYDDVRRALSRLTEVQNNKPILQSWQRTSVDQCYERLRNLAEDLLFNDDDDDSNENSIDNLFNAALSRARNAEARGDYYQALQEYKTAYGLKRQYWLEDRIREMEQKADAQAFAAGVATFITGMNELSDLVPSERLNGSLVHSGGYSEHNATNTPGLSEFSAARMDIFYLLVDRSFWLDKMKKIGIHIGGNVQYSSQWDDYSGSNNSGGSYSTSLDFTTIQVFAGLSFFGRLEIDYLYNGFGIDGNYNASEFSDVPIGGKLHFDGGARASVYLLNNQDLFLRISGWYVDAQENSDYKFLDPDNNDDVQTTSYGYRVEFVKAPWSLSFYSRQDTYLSNTSLNIGLNSWGLGIGLGLGLR